MKKHNRTVNNPVAITHNGIMKHRVPIITTCLIGAGLLAVATFVSVEQKTFAAEPPADPAYTAHSAHVAAGASQAGGQPPVEAQLADILARLQRLEAGKSPHSGAMPTGAGNPPPMRPMPGMGSGVKPAPAGMAGMNMTGGGKSGMGGGPAVSDQLAELRSKMQRLETTIQQQSASSAGATPMSGQPGMGSATKPVPPGMAGMSGMGAPGGMKPGGGMGSMGGSAAPPGGGMGMMAMKMDKMMGMMGKMMGGMGGGAKPAAGAPMAGTGMPMMDDDMMEMGGMGGGAAPAGAPMAGSGMGMMGMDKMEMAGMMGMMGGMGGMGGKGGSSMAMPSALPGFPGASHLYHLGATGFFLDHPQHIALSIEQQAALNQIKEQAGLDKASVNRSAQEAEQDLWTLTAADQPDNAQIEAKVAEIEKLKGDGRLRFISAIGNAAKILTDSQRQSLTGFAPPAPAAPAAPPMAGGMTDM